MGEAIDKQLDLRGVECPLNWAHARVALDAMAVGERLELLLDDPRAVRDIPAAAESCGFAPDPPVEREGFWSLTIEV